MMASEALSHSLLLAFESATRARAQELSWLEQLRAEGLPLARGEGPGVWLAASVDPSAGDPQLVAVTRADEPLEWWFDRRTMRPMRAPRVAPALEDTATRAADLADRAQLVIGRPVWLAIAQDKERLVISGVRALDLNFRFTTATYRRIAPLLSTPSTLAPLSIDALERALKMDGETPTEPRVRRVFGQAYRRIDAHHLPWSTGGAKVEPQKIMQRVTRVGRDVMLALVDAQAFRKRLKDLGPALDEMPLGALEDAALLATLRQRMGLVVEALGLLERARLATLSLLPAVEVTVGALPRPLFAALAEPRRTRQRRAIDAHLLELADALFEHGEPLRVPRSGELRRQWERTKRSLAGVRILGMDVRPDALGDSDADLLLGLEEAVAARDEQRRPERAHPERQLIMLSASGTLGPLGMAPASAQALLLRRLAWAKGALAEGLAWALLRLRRAALEAGRRLVQVGLLDVPDDALYMPLDEIEQAMEGELGAYAARARLRREDDRRFRNFVPPRKLVGWQS